MKQIYKGLVGGGAAGKVYLDFKAQGSSVEFPSHTEPYITITIGADFEDWYEVFDGILHELMEYHMICMELGYQRYFRAGCDTGDIWFRMSHAEYSEAISRAAQSISCFIDVAKEEFEKHIKKLELEK